MINTRTKSCLQSINVKVIHIYNFKISKDSAISVSPDLSGSSSRQSPDILPNVKETSLTNLHERKSNKTELNAGSDVNNSFQFCTLPRKKKIVNGGKKCVRFICAYFIIQIY